MNTIAILQLIVQILNSPAGQELEQELVTLLGKLGHIKQGETKDGQV